MPAKCYFVYILASHTRVLYVGMTSQLARRLARHRTNHARSFSARYRTHRLVYCEIFLEAALAVTRERQIKSWRREKKLALIGRQNPEWKDLSVEWRLD